MTPKKVKLTIRMSEAAVREISEAARIRGYGCTTAFIRAAIENELSERSQLGDAERRIASSLDRLFQDVFRVGRAQQALFALLDTLSKVFFTCVPEPPGEARRQAIARGRERYELFIKTAGRAMVGNARAALLDLIDNGAER